MKFFERPHSKGLCACLPEDLVNLVFAFDPTYHREAMGRVLRDVRCSTAAASYRRALVGQLRRPTSLRTAAALGVTQRFCEMVAEAEEREVLDRSLMAQVATEADEAMFEALAARLLAIPRLVPRQILQMVRTGPACVSAASASPYLVPRTLLCDACYFGRPKVVVAAADVWAGHDRTAVWGGGFFACEGAAAQMAVALKDCVWGRLRGEGTGDHAGAALALVLHEHFDPVARQAPGIISEAARLARMQLGDCSLTYALEELVLIR